MTRDQAGPHASTGRDALPRNRRTSAFERRVARALTAAWGDDASVRVVVAASGGPDSTAALVAVARALPGRVVAAHFDHRLRDAGERRSERETVERTAHALGVEVICGASRSRPDDRSEVAARNARYRWLGAVCARVGAPVCVTGHTLDDQAETVLLRLARGAGALGAAGMQPEAPWPVPVRHRKPPRLLRPLLDVTRAEVEGYLEALGIEAARDPSNATLDYDRNRIRHLAMPALLEVNPRAREHLAAFASTSRSDEEALTATARDWLAVHPRGAEADGSRELPRDELRVLPHAVAVRVIREVAREAGLVLDASHLGAVAGILGRRGARVDLPGGMATTSRDGVRIARFGEAGTPHG